MQEDQGRGGEARPLKSNQTTSLPSSNDEKIFSLRFSISTSHLLSLLVA